jgi:hypothetical protein
VQITEKPQFFSRQATPVAKSPAPFTRMSIVSPPFVWGSPLFTCIIQGTGFGCKSLRFTLDEWIFRVIIIVSLAK